MREITNKPKLHYKEEVFENSSGEIRTLYVHVHFKILQSVEHVCQEIGDQFSSVTQTCPNLCNSMNCSMPGLPVCHQLPESTQTHVHWVSDAIQPSHPLSTPSPPAFNLSQHQGLFKWVSSSHQVAKVLEFQLQHQSFQWTPRSVPVNTPLVWTAGSSCSPGNF